MLPGTRASKVLGVLSSLSGKVVGRREGMGGDLVEKAPGSDAVHRDLSNIGNFLVGPNPEMGGSTRLPEILDKSRLAQEQLLSDSKNPNYRLKSRSLLDAFPASPAVTPSPVSNT